MRLRAGLRPMRNGPGALTLSDDPNCPIRLSGLDERDLNWVFCSASEIAQPRPSPLSDLLTRILQLRGAASPSGQRRHLRIFVSGVDQAIVHALTLVGEVATLHIDVVDERKVDRAFDLRLGGGFLATNRASAASEYLSRFRHVTVGRASTWDLAILTCHHGLDPVRFSQIEQESGASITVVHHAQTSTIGPLIDRSQPSPCPQCVELAYCDDDPFRPAATLGTSALQPVELGSMRANAAAIFVAQAIVGFAASSVGAPPTETRFGQSALFDGRGSLAIVDDFARSRVQAVSVHERCTCSQHAEPFPALADHSAPA